MAKRLRVGFFVNLCYNRTSYAAMYLSRSKPETMATKYHKPKQGTSSEMLGEGILSRPIPNVESLFNRQTCITSISEAVEINVIFKSSLCFVKEQGVTPKKKKRKLRDRT